MKFSSMLTASMFTPMYSVEPCCTLGISSTSRQARGRLPSRLTTWLKEGQDWNETGHAEESSWRNVLSTRGTPGCPHHHHRGSSDSVSEWLPVFGTLPPPPSDNTEKHTSFWTFSSLRLEAASAAATKTLLFPSLQIKTQESTWSTRLYRHAKSDH